MAQTRVQIINMRVVKQLNTYRP